MRDSYCLLIVVYFIFIFLIFLQDSVLVKMIFIFVYKFLMLFAARYTVLAILPSKKNLMRLDVEDYLERLILLATY